MHTRTLTVATTAAGLALVLGACTSGGPEPAPTSDEAAVTSDDGLEGTAGNQGWMCNYVSPTAVELANGSAPQTTRMLVTEDTEDSWVCDVLVGGKGEQEPVIELSIHLGEGAWADARARAEGAEGVEPGPDHLGVSFVSPGLVTGLTMCKDPQSDDAGDKIPYALVAESFGQTGAGATEHLERAVTETAKALDQSVGCSPKLAVEEDAAQTTAP
ncbi:hypothetical protein [Ornithinimicrobium avium]|uniref:DUF3558 domain-containing protein n=1 Tax=Ornithinimicrobium avium TaxID=2283195 RepID=A0A345NQ80_9MICO|nr:hypothetical protein [Ornithinimicrobium avium]AXH97188.1 hypothetical protein DV701_14640 [Ornithinimicrobium avium]